MTNSEDQESRERGIDDVDGVDVGGVDDVGEGLAEGERGERIMEFLQAMDLQVLGACRSDERLKPLLKLNVSCDAAQHRLLAHLTQHFEPSEVGMLARCLCIPLVSIRVGKISKQGTLLCPTAIRGNLNLILLPTSDLRISFTGDDGRMERLVILNNDSISSNIVVEEISSDTSGRSFLIKVPDGEVFYFWCSEKSKLLGSELLMKMKDFLKRKPSLAELSGISNTRLNCFAIYLRAFLGPSLSTSSESSEIFRRATQSSSSPSKTLFSKNNSSQSFNLSPRSGSFKEGSSRNLSSLKNICRDKLRRRENQFSLGEYLPCVSPCTPDASSSSSNNSQNYVSEDSTEVQLFAPNRCDSLENLISLPPLSPVSKILSLPSSLLSPYYISATDSLPLPPLSSLLPVNRSSNVSNPPLEIPNIPKLGFPIFSRPNSQQFSTFTPLMCDPIVHIPVIDVCSSGPSYLVSAGGSSLSTTIPPLISESDAVAEAGARETLRLLINGSKQANSQLINMFPSERHSILATGSRGLYTGVSDIGIFSNKFANLEIASFEKIIRGEMADSCEVERDGIGDDDGSISNLEDPSD